MPIVIDSLSKVFGANKVLSNVNLELPDNSINVLLGPNGAGKTTLAKCLSTQLVFEQGDILLDNVSYKKSKKGNIRKNISVLLDGNRGLYWNLTMNQNIQYFLGISNTKIGEVKDEINSLIEKFE
ncbi:MAG TPA: ATP-binding cassette domain-containing protein, partial [Patescibacteria group bacterium]|nr:ATP-binding cassette domain-containing protein [Patescibacteria group bacterium]